MTVAQVLRYPPDRIDLEDVVVDISDDGINRLANHFLSLSGDKDIRPDRQQQAINLNQDLLDVAFHHDVVENRFAVHLVDEHVDQGADIACVPNEIRGRVGENPHDIPQVLPLKLLDKLKPNISKTQVLVLLRTMR